MVAARLDRRLSARLDPSDIVQDTLADAAGQMDDYLRNPAIPFFGWLRLIAGEHIREAHRRHLFSQRRSITRESRIPEFTDESAVDLVRQLTAHDTSPSNRLMRQERSEQVKEALATLSPQDREVLAIRYVERLSMAEMAEALGMSEGAAKQRHLRAVVRLKGLLEADTMIDHDELVRAADDADPALLELTEQITDRLQAGDEIDVRDYLRRYPQWAGAICKLLPTMQRSRRLWPGRRPRPPASQNNNGSNRTTPTITNPEWKEAVS